MNTDVVALIAQLVGPLIGAGAGSYFGLKGALNGLREAAKRTEANIGRVHERVDDVRDRVISVDFNVKRLLKDAD